MSEYSLLMFYTGMFASIAAFNVFVETRAFCNIQMYRTILSAESQMDTNAVQWCSVEN